MIRKQFTGYVTPAIEWLLSPDVMGGGILCQSPSGGLDDIVVGAEEDDWLN